MAEKKRTGKKKPNRSNLAGVITIAGIVAVLLVVLLSGSQKLSVRNEQYESQKEELSQQIQDVEVRSGEIEKLKDYVNSKEFIEKMAREKLGLVYRNEIIFKATQ